MSALSSLLARDQVVPVKKIEEAIQRQVISGGELPTVLLEVGAAAENVIAAYHAAAVELEPIGRDEVMSVSEDVTRVLSRAIAERYSVVPVALEANTIVVASARLLDAESLAAVSAASGRNVEVRIATEPRIVAALQHYYGVAPIARMRRLVAKLATQDAGALPTVSRMLENVRSSLMPFTSSGPSGASAWLRSASSGSGAEARESEAEGGLRGPNNRAGAASKPQQPSSVVTVGVAKVVGVGSNTRSTTASYARVPEAAPAPAANVPRPEAESSPPPRRMSMQPSEGTLDADAAIAALAAAESRDAVLAAAFSHARTFFEYCAIFAAHEDDAEGLDAAGDGASPETVREISIDLTRPGSMRDVRQLLGAKAGTLDSTDADRELAKWLDRAAKQPSVIIPVAIRQRVVLFIYGDRGGASLGVGDVGELIAFLPRVSDALQRLILQRKRRSDGRVQGIGHGGRSEPAPAKDWASSASEVERDTSEDSFPSVASEASPLTEGGEVGGSVASEPADDVSEVVTGRPRAFDLLGVPRRAPEPPSLVPAAAAPPADSEARSPNDGSDGAGARKRISARPPEDTTYRASGGEEEVVLTRRKTRRSSRPAAASSSAVSPEIPKAAPVPVDATPLEPSATAGWSDDDEDDAPEISVAEARSSLPPDATIITDLGLDLDDIVDDLIRSDRSSVDTHVERLVAFGEPALRVLARRFPGPSWVGPRPGPEGPHPRARDVSPILYAMVAFRQLAVAHIANLLDQRDPEIRYYAALLAAEVTHRDLVVRVGRRVLDDDPGVRAVALLALRAAKRFEGEIAEVLTHFRRVAGNDRAPIASRRLAVELLGDMRDSEAVTMLTDTLGDADAELAAHAHKALARITKQDFGPTTIAWQPWLAANADKHRIEWLIDALLHDDEPLRREAGDELKAITKEFFGFQSGLARKEREVVHRKYRKWWDTIGHDRFVQH